MGTSKSASRAGAWEAGVSLFSGRPDPSWSVPAEQTRQLEAIWEQLEPAADGPPTAPPLGYRGCFARDPGGRRWYAYGGRVVLTNGGASETRADPNQEFATAVLESAPADVLPATVRSA